MPPIILEVIVPQNPFLAIALLVLATSITFVFVRWVISILS